MDNYTLVGNQINYSLSPLIHNYLFTKFKIDETYNITNCKYVEQKSLMGFKAGNVTIPHKQAVANLDIVIDNHYAKRDMTINTFKIEDNQLHGICTDQYGIIDSIYKLCVYNIRKKTHIIFGDGATSKMLKSVLINDFRIPPKNIFIVSRKNLDLDSEVRIISNKMINKFARKNSVFYNTTPLGNEDNAHISPFTNKQLDKAEAVFDLGYSPKYNQLAKVCYTKRIKYLNGLNMLIVQALHSFEYWTGIDVSGEYVNVRNQLLYNTSPKLIVVAMPFAGKSTLQKKYKTCSIDLDNEIENYTGMKNSDYINENGIEQFRVVESQCLKSALNNKEVKLIFLGGGTLTSSSSLKLLNNELLVYMQLRLETLVSRFDKSRANIQSEQYLRDLYKERDPHYINLSQLRVSSRGIERVINEYLDNKWS